MIELSPWLAKLLPVCLIDLDSGQWSILFVWSQFAYLLQKCLANKVNGVLCVFLPNRYSKKKKRQGWGLVLLSIAGSKTQFTS